MTVKKNKVTVEIYGESYPIKGEAEIERIERVAALVNERMRRTARSNPQLSTTKVAVLAALNIADELLRLEQDYRQLVQMLKEGK